MIEQLDADRAGFVPELRHFLQPKAQFQAGGIHHLGEQQGIGSPAAHQAPEDAIAHPRQRRLQHPAAQLAAAAIARQQQRLGEGAGGLGLLGQGRRGQWQGGKGARAAVMDGGRYLSVLQAAALVGGAGLGKGAIS